MEPALIAFWAKKVVALLILPPAGPLLLIGLGLAVSRLRKLAWLGWAYAVLVSTPITVDWLAAPLETAPPVSAAALRQTQAIVILGAGTRSHAPEYGEATVNALALERLRYGAGLARDTGLPVLVTGGAPEHHTPEATMMRAALEQDFGITVRWAESAALDTRDNADLSAALLRAEGIERIALVTHAAHMPRAQAAFEAAGLTVTPAPTVWLSNPDPEIEFGDFVPNARSAYAGWFAVHEWIGGLAYRLSAAPTPPPTPAPDRQ
ncbi:MAG: YdcF family protein [Proteobacteria bacterium]|nr:MAG: YdcF family protein [Pseudomonadota bacterium]